MFRQTKPNGAISSNSAEASASTRGAKASVEEVYTSLSASILGGYSIPFMRKVSHGRRQE